MKRIAVLDGVRGIAILYVLAFHINLPGELAGILPGGFLGVDIFFVLSGFLITSILLEEWRRSHTIRLRDFYIRRALRLFPALFFVLLYSFLYTRLSHDPDMVAKVKRGIVSTALYYSNWIMAYYAGALGFLNHTWSLAVEEQFYLIWPVTLLLLLKSKITRRFLPWVMVLLIAASCVLKGFYAHEWMRAYTGTDVRADELLLGGLLAYGREYGLLNRWRFLFHKITVYIATAIILIMPFFVLNDRSYLYYGGLTFFAAAVVILIGYIVTQPHTLLTKVLSWKPLMWIGQISYGLYLWHLPVAALIDSNFPEVSLLIRKFTFVFLSIGIAAVSYYLIEQPCLRLKAKFSHAVSKK